MKIQKPFFSITYITAYRIISISGIILMIGLIIYAVCFESDMQMKSFIIFLAILGLFTVISLLSVANLFDRQEKIKILKKEK